VPILVVGADHQQGSALVRKLVAPGREVRAFVSDPANAAELKALGAKVALGDLSDEGHIAAAATHCFSIAFVAAALTDGRELAFLTPEQARLAWARAAAESGVTRVIWVGQDPPALRVPEQAVVDIDPQRLEEIAAEVARLDDLVEL
jgi:uncharacterized protein YbjT (DUF2867 family)